MTRKFPAALAALLLSSAAVFPAGAADGLYLGGGIGLASVKDEVDTETLDSDDTAYKAFVGWRFDAVRFIDLAVEAAYTEFGKPSQVVAGQDIQFNLRGASIAGLLLVPLGPIDLFGKAGLMSWRAELTRNGAATSSRSGSDPFYGAGVGLRVWKIGVRAEYERFQIKDVDRVELLSVSALIQF